jgi:fibronectin type 3 domain-containing protein
VATPVPAYSDTTARPGESWCYVVRAAASADPLVESAPSNEACVEVKDIVAPAPPAGLTLLPREDGDELTWSPSSEPDLRAYRVYRTRRRQRERIGEVLPPATTFLAKEAALGGFARYTVTAVDEAGNESADAEPVESRRP